MPKKKYCIVPNCGNTSENSDKVFVGVPKDFEKRKIWWRTVGNTSVLAYLKANLYCCQDHFNIPDDFYNWYDANQPGRRLRMKDGVLPSINRNSSGYIPGDCDTKIEIKEEPLDHIKEEPLYYIKEESISDNESHYNKFSTFEFSTIGGIYKRLLEDDDCIFADFVLFKLRQIPSKEERDKLKHSLRKILLRNIKEENASGNQSG